MNKYLSFCTIVLSATMAGCSGTTVSSGDEFKQVELPDGSIVSLNKESSVKYNEAFSDRTVHLEGEAFFDVPEGNGEFTVTTNQGEVVVMGTSFNVKSSGDDMEVEVEEGEVNMKADGKDKRIGRGKKGKFSKGKSIELGNADLKHKKWMGDLQKEFKSLGKDFKKAGREVGKDAKKLGRDLKKAVKEAEKDLKK